MAYSVDTGNVSTADPNQETVVRDVRDAITYLDEDNTQFTTMLMRMPQEAAYNFKKEWVEDQLLPQHTALSATVSNSVTTIPVTTNEGLIARPGDVARNTLTGEAMLITAAGASAWTVVRGLGSSAVSSATANATLVIVANMNEQNAAAPIAVITERSVNYNYSAIFRDVLDFAGTERVTEHYGDGSLEKAEKRKKLIEHKWRQERAAFWGARAYTTGANGKPWTSVGGLNSFVTTNRFDVATSLTRNELQDILRNALQYGNRSQKVLFCGPIVAQTIGTFLQDNWVRADPTDKVWGVSVDFVISSAFGGKRVPVVVKGDWMRFGEGSAGQYGSWGFIVDMPNVQRHPLSRHGISRDTHYREVIQNPDVDGFKAEYLTECSYSFRNEKSHTVFYNVQVAA